MNAWGATKFFKDFLRIEYSFSKEMVLAKVLEAISIGSPAACWDAKRQQAFLVTASAPGPFGGAVALAHFLSLAQLCQSVMASC